ncbi:MAG: uncharacterized protein PWP15_576 [Methanothermococcus sp.]|jgi:hypothetical protein|uniref:DUF447 domain-containing protein n=1 Tax=Methanothermococcus TaxID=155862 RepID=UPI00036AAD4C|nr:MULTISPECIES: DUF447 domain-containing protein [Methanothermococcus]MDK2790069.1 uncharacterized protein [Methanothermococcus sp.]MDK2987121.1 uncharacterized protein [Methanothermococcus sp.]
MKFEIVVTSGKGNRAPIGAFMSDNKITLHLYEGSHTYQNLKEDDFYILNICEPYLVAESVLDDNGNYEYLEYDDNNNNDNGNNNDNKNVSKRFCYLKDSYKIILVRINNRKFIETKNEYGSSKMMIVDGTPVFEKVLKHDNELKPYNRADGLIVEMAVLYSRLNLVSDDTREEMKKEMEKYLRNIKKVGSKKHIELGKRFMDIMVVLRM